MKEKVTTTIRLTSRKRELVDEVKRIVHVALLSKYFANAVRVRKTVQKTTKWNRQVYEAKITVEISVKIAELQKNYSESWENANKP